MLGIRKQTLYAYVSRGYVRSVSSGRSRERHYAREDLERIQARSKAHSSPDAIAAATLNLGHPVVPTSITELTPDGPRYRGRLAVDLAKQGAVFEQVAELLWTGIWHETERPWHRVRAPANLTQWLGQLPTATGREQLLELFSLVVMQLAMGRGTLQDRLISGRPLDAAREVIMSLVGCFALLSTEGKYRTADPGVPVAEALLTSLEVPATKEDCALLNATLVLLADHEFSPGTFSARIASSSGSSMHSCIAAAMATSSGLEIGRRYDRIEDFLTPSPRVDDLTAKVATQLQAGQDIPGFGHPLYPDGDPRADFLLGRVGARKNKSAGVKNLLAFVDKLKGEHELHPRHELAVVAVCRLLKLPAGTPSALFVLARTAGWVAHVLEQRLTSTMIRPRARFTPSSGPERSPSVRGAFLEYPIERGLVGRPNIDAEAPGHVTAAIDLSSSNGRMAHLVKDAARSFLRSLQVRLATEGVSLGHWTFLRILWDKDGITQRELSHEAGVMEPTTVVALRAMEAAGFIRRARRGENKRSFYVFLTPQGRSLQKNLVPFAEEVNALAAEGLPPEQVAMTKQSLQIMLSNLAGDPLLAAVAADDAGISD